MKKLPILFLAAFTILITFVSCKKSNSGSPSSSGSGTGHGTITGTSGIIFNVSGNNGFFEKALPNSTQNITSDTLISILATINGTTNLDIQLYNVSAPGTYSCNYSTPGSSATVVYNAAVDSSFTTIIATNPGTVTVSAISASGISGTYNVTVQTISHTSLNLTGTFTGNY
jgi:hypothetical protein